VEYGVLKVISGIILDVNILTPTTILTPLIRIIGNFATG